LLNLCSPLFLPLILKGTHYGALSRDPKLSVQETLFGFPLTSCRYSVILLRCCLKNLGPSSFQFFFAQFENLVFFLVSPGVSSSAGSLPSLHFGPRETIKGIAHTAGIGKVLGNEEVCSYSFSNKFHVTNPSCLYSF